MEVWQNTGGKWQDCTRMLSLISMFTKETNGKRRKVEFGVDNYIAFKNAVPTERLEGLLSIWEYCFKTPSKI